MNRIQLSGAIALGALLAAAPVFAATPKSGTTASPAAKPLCSTLKKAGKQAAPPDCIADSPNPASSSNPASARYSGLPDTTSNAESSMPSTASSPSSSEVYKPDTSSVAPGSTAPRTTQPKLSGDSSK